ncbi:MAG: Kef family K(+) transporter [Alphaproteobacteria bacterium]|nr:Kef family K(+) transporter [Alphaproteobacteria bacterium]
MEHHTPLIAIIVVGLVLAFILGALAQRIRISPLVGYLLAGVVLGPYTPGFVADQSLAPQLAEIGVILLMFGVGLHFSVRDLLAVKTIAVPGAIVQIGAATVLGVGLAMMMGWPLGGGLVFGLALSVASTVVLLRALQERRMVETEQGRIAVGWLIVEDLAMVLALVLLPAVAGLMKGDDGVRTTNPQEVLFAIGMTIGKVAAFVALMLIVGRRAIPWLLHHMAYTGSRELFRLAVLSIALGVAYASAQLFGVSFALGAFFAGMVLAESELSHQAAAEVLPLRDAFAVLFFVSVGMLFDPMILIRDPLPVLGTLFIILFGKSIAAFLIARAFGRSPGTSLIISASLAQIGEFSFILAALGISLGLMPEAGRDLIVAGAILSIMVNPLAFAALDHFRTLGVRRNAGNAPPADQTKPVTPPPAPPEQLAGHTIIVGYGRVGSVIGETLTQAGEPIVVIEESPVVITALRDQKIEVVEGPGSPEELLSAANVGRAERLFIAIPAAFEAGQFVEIALAANEAIKIVARAHTDAEAEHLRDLGAQEVVMGEREIGLAMAARAIAGTA